MNLNKKFRLPLKPMLSTYTQDVQTVWWAMFTLVVISIAFSIVGILVDWRVLSKLQIGGLNYSGANSAVSGFLIAILCALLGESYRYGWHRALAAGTLVLSVVVVVRTPSYAFENSIPQVIWVGPMVAFALTSLRFSIFTTAVTIAMAYIVHTSHGAFHEASPFFVIFSISALLILGKLRHKNILQSERLQSQKALMAAFYDTVTGLPNRRLVEDRLNENIKTALRMQHRLAVIFVDIDRFKDINDAFGHDAGDQLLVDVAERLRGCASTAGTIGRFGTDVFAILIGGISNRADIDGITENIFHSFKDSFTVKNTQLPMTISMGVAVCPDDGDRTDVLLQHANQTLHNAKVSGGNNIKYFTPALQEEAQYRLRLTQDLRTALLNQQLIVHYQPIVDLTTGTVHKAEALVRWCHPSLGFISPAVFIPLAEASGLIHELGEWVFKTAAAQVKQWRKYCNDFQISVNRSPLQFTPHALRGSNLDKDTAIDASWEDTLCALGLPGDSIAVEITEGLLLDNGKHVSEQLNAFRSAGMSISLDDFGTGYSSLAYLQRHPIDVVKIDRAFVRDLVPSSKNFTLCRAIITMAHELGMKVVAEGIETSIERDLLAQIGCDFAQGYLLGKPMSATHFEALLHPVTQYVEDGLRG